ncbi:MAG: DUF4169 family protein [Pseudomonadota bacterium]
MADKTVINLNRARKARARATAKAQADENAVKFGRRKTERTADEANKAKAERTLDGHKRDPDAPR